MDWVLEPVLLTRWENAPERAGVAFVWPLLPAATEAYEDRRNMAATACWSCKCWIRTKHAADFEMGEVTF